MEFTQPHLQLAGGAAKTPRGRYAPSPTGGLHLGNARTALAAWLHTRAREGTFVLRIEDLDRQRCRPEWAQLNLQELEWLGLDWDEGPGAGGQCGPYYQSQRGAYYQDILEQLRPCLYPCYLSRKDLYSMATAPHGPMEGYGLAERALNAQLAEARQAAGKQPSLRFKGPQSKVCFEDLLQGPQAWPVGDFVVFRADGEWAYQLAVVADDLAMGITEVVRGDDLLPSTAAQVLLWQQLGAEPPQWLHLPLLYSQEGERLSKRSGALTLDALRRQGIAPQQLTGWLAWTLGLLARPEAVTPQELLADYALQRLSRQIWQLSAQDLEWLRQGGNVKIP